MINLRKRSYQKELMDGDDIPFEDMAITLKELNVINTKLGGHTITLDGMKALAKGDHLTICEIGCGGGDNMAAIDTYYRKYGVPCFFIGIDMNAACIEYAKQQYDQLSGQWIVSDYREASFSRVPDIIFSSLFCHHFTDDELVSMLRWMHTHAKKGFFINDLERHWLAYYLIKYLTKFFSKSYLVRNDACLSVARGFKRRDWKKLLAAAGIDNYFLQRRWAFRWLLIVKKSTSA